MPSRITTIELLKKAINDLPGDWYIATNPIGNLTVFSSNQDESLKPADELYDFANFVGYIELLNMKYFDRKTTPACELIWLNEPAEKDGE